MRGTIRTLVPTTAVALVALAAVGCGESDSGGGGGGGDKKVVLLLPNTTTTRFVQQDGPLFKRALEKHAPGTSITIQQADNDATKQLNQAKAALTKGVSAIVLISVDPSSASSILRDAEASKVPVVLYDHLADGGKAEAHIVFNRGEVGNLQAKALKDHLADGPKPLRVARLNGEKGQTDAVAFRKGQEELMQPLIDSGQVEVVCDDWADGWVPANGQKLMEQCLTRIHNKVDAVLTMNDGLGGAAIAALKVQDLAGKVPVYGGQDADLAGVQNIIRGYQDDTVYKPFRQQADVSAQITAAVLKGDPPPKNLINGETDMGSTKVPAAILTPQLITAKNIDKIMDDGVYSWSQVCKGSLANVGACKNQTGG